MRASGEGIPWGELLTAALRMGLAPAAFWRTSLAEWLLLMADAKGGETMGRAEFEALVRACGEMEVNGGE